MNTPTKQRTPPGAPKKPTNITPPSLFSPGKVTKCLFRIPIEKPTAKFWISKCPQDMVDNWERY
jgi:hypothetical protein